MGLNSGLCSNMTHGKSLKDGRTHKMRLKNNEAADYHTGPFTQCGACDGAKFYCYTARKRSVERLIICLVVGCKMCQTDPPESRVVILLVGKQTGTNKCKSTTETFLWMFPEKQIGWHQQPDPETKPNAITSHSDVLHWVSISCWCSRRFQPNGI